MGFRRTLGAAEFGRPDPGPPRRARLLRSGPAGGQRLQERGPGVPARVLLGAAALAGGGRHLARLRAPGRGAAARRHQISGALRDRSRGATVTWIGHSTVLVQLDGVTFLTDPTWADRSGPFSGFIGVRRYTPPGIAFDDLPPIDFVLISHDHYDHLDEPTVRRLAAAFDPALRRAPRHQGLARRSRHHQRGGARLGGIGHGQGTDGRLHTRAARRRPHRSSTRAVGSGPRGRCWARNASTSAGTPATTATSRRPAIGSGRSTWPRCPSGPTRRASIAKPVHISPEEALQAALDLRATHLLGVHWGTFALAREPYDEPPARLRAEVAAPAARSRLAPGSSSPAKPWTGNYYAQ